MYFKQSKTAAFQPTFCKAFGNNICPSLTVNTTSISKQKQKPDEEHENRPQIIDKDALKALSRIRSKRIGYVY